MQQNDRQLTPFLKPSGAWAFAIGTSVGWGSLMVTSNTYLAQAGPWGSVLGMLIGMAIMLIICRNYAYMMNAWPEAGGTYAFVRETFGYDHAFLTAWFLALTYLSMLWANATALPLFARYFVGEAFRWWRMYQLFGYDIYLGEALLSIVFVAAAAFLCARFKKGIAKGMVWMAGGFAAAFTLCFAAALFRHRGSFAPGFVPDRGALGQVLRIACISPWAFIGFESISHGTAEFSFPHTKIFRTLLITVISTTVLYIFATLLSVTAYPPQYASWFEYIQDLGHLNGIMGLPAFYAASRYLGSFGVMVLGISLFFLIITSLIGNITALSRLLYALGRDDVLPRRFGELNAHGTPGRAIALVAVVSCVVPFLGRTAIGWIVDVTTLGATLIYGFVSAATVRLAAKREDRIEHATGLVGLVLMAVFLAVLLLPSLFTTGSMATESYFLFVVWSVLGFFLFRLILKRDRNHRFGQSIIVWISLLSLILFVSLVWMSQSILQATTAGMRNVEEYYIQAGVPGAQASIISRELSAIRSTNARSIVVVVGLFALSLGVLLNNYALMSRRARASEAELGHVRNIAATDPLTGVKSKHAWLEKEKDISAQIASGTMEPFAIVVCDLNGLKHVNDTLGHKAGDEYIRSASHMICEIFQHSPVYRTGGDEFSVILSGRDYAVRAELMSALHDRSVEHIAREKAVVSGGISEYHAGVDRDVHEVYVRADARMYEEKKALKALGAKTR